MTFADGAFGIAMALVGCMGQAGLSLLALIVFAGILRAIGRTGLWGGPANRAAERQPEPNTPKTGKGTRRVEMLVLLAVGVMGILGEGMYRTEGGPLLALGRLQPGFALANLIILGVSLALVLASAAVALGGRTKAAFFLIAYVVGMYQGAIDNNFASDGPSLLEFFTPPGASDTVVDLTFEMEDPQAAMDVRVNGVHLGITPLTIPWTEFREKVPVWNEAPAGWEDKTDRYWSRLTPLLVDTTRITAGKGERRKSHKAETVPGDGYYIALEFPGGSRALMPHQTKEPRDYGQRYHRRVVYRLRPVPRPLDVVPNHEETVSP